MLDKLTYAGNRANLDPVAESPRFRFVQGDICDVATVAGSCRASTRSSTSPPSRTSTGRSPGAAEFVTTNVLGTQVLLEAAAAAGVGRFVHVSTDEVYGSIAEGSWPETHPLEPNSPYAASKAASDLLALAHARTYGLDVRITRCSNNYGPYQFPEKVIPLFVTNLIDGGTVPLYGDGAQRARLAARRRPLPRHPAGAGGGRPARSTTSAAAPS